MLDFVIFAGTAIIGLLVLLFFLFSSGDNKSPEKVSQRVKIPRWDTPPLDAELGDLGELSKHGSLYQYLLHLHDNGKVPVTSFWWGGTHVISACSPQAFKELVGLVNRPALLFKMIEPLIGEASIQYANDEDWDQRQKCLFKTLKGEDLKSYFPHFVTIAQETEARWLSYSSSDKVPLMKEVFPMTVRGICQTCLGNVFEDQTELEELSDAYHKCWREMEVRLVSGEPEEGSKRIEEFRRNRQVMVDTVSKIIKSRQRSGQDGKFDDLPFIDSMLQNYSSDDKIVSDVISFLVGGFHNSGYMMTWLLWYLAVNPASQDRLRQELDREVGGECGDKLKDYALRTDTFLRQVEDETLRLSTLSPFAARYSDKDMKVCGYHIPAKTPIISALGVALKNNTEWQDVEKWDPDRFAPNGPHGKRGNEFCPFGIHSRRKCPGYLFSYFEVSIFVAILLQKFEVVPVGDEEVIKCYGLVTKPQEELYVQLHQRYIRLHPYEK